MESLEIAIRLWEDALNKYTNRTNSSTDESNRSIAILDADDAQFCQNLQDILYTAYALQDNCELLFLDERSVLFRAESSQPSDGGSLHRSAHDKNEETSSQSKRSSVESFASAQDRVADLREFEEFGDVFGDIDNLPLYQTALRQLEDNGIPYRKIRTELVHCGTDVEFLAKLHCIRLACQYLFLNDEIKYWFINSGRQILTDLLLFAEKDPKEFIIAYENMFEFLNAPNRWGNVVEELSLRGVKAITLYDVLLDLILMDAFTDLENPPSSVLSVVQNRWLSNSFKETALTTAVWSVLRMKRKKLKYSDGFLAHFYSISEQLSPILAWGFLGPDEELRGMCTLFKEEVMGFISDIFSFEKCRYTSVEELAKDIFENVKIHMTNLSSKLSVNIPIE